MDLDFKSQYVTIIRIQQVNGRTSLDCQCGILIEAFISGLFVRLEVGGTFRRHPSGAAANPMPADFRAALGAGAVRAGRGRH